MRFFAGRLIGSISGAVVGAALAYGADTYLAAKEVLPEELRIALDIALALSITITGYAAGNARDQELNNAPVNDNLMQPSV